MIFLKKFDNQKNIRFPMFEYALILAQKRNLKVLVETGTSRGKNKFFFFRKYNWKDGMSTMIFGEFANFINGKLYTCDVSKGNIKSAMNFTKSLENNITFCVDDSVNFLSKFNLTIDFLYLDSLDGHNPKIASEHQLKEIKTAINKLHENSLVLLDDKLLKTNLSLDFLKKNNFKILKETDFQILLSKTL
jgi:hypothetical protein